MSDPTPTLEQFISAHLGTVDQLRAMLLLCAVSPAGLEAIEVATKLYMPLPAATEILARLETNGLAAASGEPLRYRRNMSSPELNGLMEQVIKLDRERPVTLLNMIYDKPSGIQAFIDAFNLRKERNE